MESIYSFKYWTVWQGSGLTSIKTSNRNFESYFCLPYNPAGEDLPYSKSGHSVPRRLFDMEDENFVLIGSSLWNKIGDSTDTYDELMDVFDEAGRDSLDCIRREYFGL
ncbi:TdeIII family type II restriction endonuclease [Lentibacillus cibarius]|nr:TdeIII family type II restriction endonuclease [Lentibacillus cibarius]